MVARNLLSSTEDSIAEIAFATGLSSQSHMTTALTGEHGVTPGQLRNSPEFSPERGPEFE
jgi:AraC-like DNA-binding protein